MTQLPYFPQVKRRPAVDCDREDVFEFCKGIWEGDDYVPLVWDEWFQDSNGLLVIAEHERHAIGCAKITQLSPEQW